MQFWFLELHYHPTRRRGLLCVPPSPPPPSPFMFTLRQAGVHHSEDIPAGCSRGGSSMCFLIRIDSGCHDGAEW